VWKLEKTLITVLAFQLNADGPVIKRAITRLPAAGNRLPVLKPLLSVLGSVIYIFGQYTYLVFL
jgi:hypothetical protein